VIDIVLRSIVESDAPNIYAVALEAWQFTYHGIFSQEFIEEFVQKHYSPEAITSLLPRIESGTLFFYVAEDEQKIVGFCNIGITEEGARLFRIYLLPSQIGRGIGWSLLHLGEEFLTRKGVQEYSCFVHQRNEIGKRFYARHGFQHVSEKDHPDEWYLVKHLSRLSL